LTLLIIMSGHRLTKVTEERILV